MNTQDLGKVGVSREQRWKTYKMKNRWKEYFNTLLNVENGKGEIQEGEEWVIEIAQQRTEEMRIPEDQKNGKLIVIYIREMN